MIIIRNDDFNGHIFIDQLLAIQKQLNVAIMLFEIVMFCWVTVINLLNIS